MPNRSKDKLRKRWNGELLAAVNDALDKRLALPAPFPPYNGLADLRGVFVRSTCNGLTFRCTDLSFARTGMISGFSNCTIEDCKFVEAGPFGIIADTCVRVDFTLAEIGHLRGSFVDCIFCKSKLFAVSGNEVHFVRCDFRNANLRNVELFHCLFENCDFSGARLRGASFFKSRFIGTSILAQDLSKSLLERITVVDNGVERQLTVVPKDDVLLRMGEAELREQKGHEA